MFAVGLKKIGSELRENLDGWIPVIADFMALGCLIMTIFLLGLVIVF